MAAGQGTRMRSARPKVLHRLGGLPLVDHVLALAATISDRKPVVVINPAHTDVEAHLDGRADVAVQAAALGTGDALRSVPAELRHSGPVLILSADVPLLRPEAIAALVAAQAEGDAVCAVLTLADAGMNGLGRVSRNAAGDVESIVEQRDLVPGAVVPTECNAGVYVFDGAALWPALDRLTNDNAQGEYYLTDVIALVEGRVAAVEVADADEARGINDRRQLATAEGVLRHRTLDRLMLSGVTIEDPATTFIDATVVIGEDSVIGPMTVIRGVSTFGRDCELGPLAQIDSVVGGDRVRIGASALDHCELGDDVTIGHFDRVRPDVRLDSGVSLGTHAEVKNSTVGAGTHISHFSCVLDSDVGSGVNIGAGTVTCNFDGAAKHRTTIADGVFVGTNSTLVAPLTIAADSYIAAGSVVNQDVPAGALAVGRARQRNVAGWVTRRNAKASKAEQ